LVIKTPGSGLNPDRYSAEAAGSGSVSNDYGILNPVFKEKDDDSKGGEDRHEDRKKKLQTIHASCKRKKQVGEV
jgi:hypothetical protein